ncbi:hypothetical protein CTM63_09570 [Prevotella intermedia]|jgi:helicase domain protein|nr:hypothetical protein CTM63_09570 [Prevotella intermedia]
MKTIYDILTHFLEKSTIDNRTQFQRLIRSWLCSDVRYTNLIKSVWLWKDFPSRLFFIGKNAGGDLFGKTYLGDFSDPEDVIINKFSVDSLSGNPILYNISFQRVYKMA